MTIGNEHHSIKVFPLITVHEWPAVGCSMRVLTAYHYVRGRRTRLSPSS